LENIESFITDPDLLVVKKWINKLQENLISYKVQEAGKKIQEIAGNGFTPDLIANVSRLLIDAVNFETLGIERLDKALLDEISRMESNSPVKGLMPRSATIRRLSGPYISGDLVVIAGGAGIGKTFWILKEALHQVVNNNTYCLFVPLEMSKEALARRVLSQAFNILPGDVRDANITGSRAQGARDKSKLYENFFISKNINNPAQIESAARWIIAQGAQKLLIVVDPAILAEPNRVSGNATQDARNFWREMKIVTERLATEIDTCVTIVAHHVTKEASRNKEQKRPSLEDLDTAGHQNISLGIIVRREDDLVTAYCVKNRHDMSDWQAPMLWRSDTLSFEDITEFCPLCAMINKETEMIWDGRKWYCSIHKAPSHV
jgi:replicative DNA helicase